MDRTKRATSRGRCEHDAFPVEVLSVCGGEKKIAHCLGCGRSGPAREGSAEALAALRGAWRRGLVGPIPRHGSWRLTTLLGSKDPPSVSRCGTGICEPQTEVSDRLARHRRQECDHPG